MNDSAWNFDGPWEGYVDVSVWLRSAEKMQGRVHLVLMYEDGNSKLSF